MVLPIRTAGARVPPGPRGRQAQRQVAGLLRRNNPRQAGAVLVYARRHPGIPAAPGRPGIASRTGVIGRGDPDLLATIDAEDAFDLTERLGSIMTPTLIVGGDRDALTKAGVRGDRCAASSRPPHPVPGKGYMATTARRLAREVLMFLDRDLDASPG